MIIGISGKIGSGKDTVGKIIQILVDCPHFSNKAVEEYLKKEDVVYSFKNKKFADKLKNIVCLLIGCTREQLEDREFKEKELGEEWNKYYIANKKFPNIPLNGYFNTSLEAVENMQQNVHFTEHGVARLNLEVNKRVLTPRLLLQLLGTECGRSIIHPNVWVNALFSKYQSPIYYMCDKCGEENILPHQLLEIESRFKKQGYLDNEFVCPNCKGTELEGDITKVITSNPCYWIITDTRFPNELKAIKDRGGISIRVNRLFVTEIIGENKVSWTPIPTVDYIPHESETALDNAKFDYTIDNSGTIEGLIKKVKEILIKEKII